MVGGRLLLPQREREEPALDGLEDGEEEHGRGRVLQHARQRTTEERPDAALLAHDAHLMGRVAEGWARVRSAFGDGYVCRVRRQSKCGLPHLLTYLLT